MCPGSKGHAIGHPDKALLYQILQSALLQLPYVSGSALIFPQTPDKCPDKNPRYCCRYRISV